MIQSALDRLTNVHPEMEIWWDSSPLIFEPWVKKMVDVAPSNKKTALNLNLVKEINFINKKEEEEINKKNKKNRKKNFK